MYCKKCIFWIQCGGWIEFRTRNVFAQTRLLVTNSVAYLQQMDAIVVMKNGEISEIGTFQELLSHKAAFAEFVVTYLNDPDIYNELDPARK